MHARAFFAPRDPVGGARAVFSLIVVSQLVIIAMAFVTGAVTRNALSWAAVATCALTIPASWMLRRVRFGTDLPWPLLPFGWIAILVGCAFCLRAPNMHVEVLLLFPAFYASRQLVRNAAMVIIGLSAVLVLVVSLTSVDPSTEFGFAVFLDPVLLASAIRLTATGQRVETMLSEMQVRATTDGLTGLGTRHTLQLAASKVRTGPDPLDQALMLFDIDHFKKINDEFGHPGGDAALVQLAQVIVQHIRADDLPCRMGGDEIAVLCRGISRSAAHRRAERIRQHVAAHDFQLPTGGVASMTISVGVAHQSAADADFDALYAQADQALYQAKRAGRNQVAQRAA